MHAAAALRSLVDTVEQEEKSIDAQIRDFLDGESDGAALLHQLYDSVLSEPVPERLRAVLKR
jgi:hypothetical protein